MNLVKNVLVAVLVVSAASCATSQSTISLTSKTSTSHPTSITCDFDGLSINDVISWQYLNVSGAVSNLASNTRTLNLTSVTEVGVYTCHVNGSVAFSITAAYLSPPIIKNTKQSVTFNDGNQDRTLSCLSEGSYPLPDFEWRWKKNEETGFLLLDPDVDQNINITTTAESSSLLIHNLTFGVAGTYQCYANNSAGNKTVDVLVRVKDRLAALWPFLGIVAEVIVLIVIIFVYEKRSKKAAQVKATGSKDDTDIPLKNSSETGSELRNRNPTNNNK